MSRLGLEETVRELLKRQQIDRLSEKRDTWGRTLLCAAILSGSEEVVRAILRHGGDIEVVANEQKGGLSADSLCVIAYAFW